MVMEDATERETAPAANSEMAPRIWKSTLNVKYSTLVRGRKQKR